MSKEITINRPKIRLEVSCGLVRKAHLRNELNASNWEFEKVITFLFETDAEFVKAYEPYLKKWSVPEALAIRFVEHVCPGWEVEMVIG